MKERIRRGKLEKGGRKLGEVSAQTERVHRMVDDLLQYARPKPPQTMCCDLRELVERGLTLVRPQAEKQGVEIGFDCRANDSEVCADPAQIQQAILNIVLNGIQAMPGGGRLDLALEEDPAKGWVCLGIRDTGCGMTYETRKRIFSPFFTTKPGGTGLGLSITRGIIERHDGTLDFTSVSKEGTVFTISLPLVSKYGCLGDFRRGDPARSGTDGAIKYEI